MTKQGTAMAMSQNEDFEITPEMIEAGAVELSRFNSDFECLEEAAARIYRAMVVAAREH
jgi:hypothetical protein